MQSQQSIGVFDSGVGGTSIWKEIVTLLPKESTIYLADSANAPYGNKSEKQILALCIKNTEKLIALGVKIIVVACNTATTNAIDYLRATYPIPFIGIEPAIKPAALQSKQKSIGILATKGTLNSKLFHNTIEKYTQNTTVVEIIGKGLVPLIEKGDLNNPELATLLKKYITPMLEAKIDYLVLGCSHYPYLITLLEKIIPKHIQIIDSGEAVAKQTQYILESNMLLNSNKQDVTHLLLTNSNLDVLSYFINSFANNQSEGYKNKKSLNINIRKEDF